MALPSGTVTFLFTDIEGSTKLSQTYHDQWETMRARHHAILHKAVQDHNGHVFQIIGDEFCVAFHTAIDAVRAAADAQRMLFTEPWDPAPIKVRMGIHSGTAHVSVADDQLGGYTGYIALARVSRLRSAGHGGQVLVSLSAEELIRDELPEEIGLRDLGARRLKDLNRPEQIFQLIIPGMPADFPPLKTLDAYRHNLPTQMTRFIGRGKEMEEITQAISAHRLVTLTGSGGTGKTRLALQVAADLLDQFSDGVWLVELESLTDPILIPQTILSACGVTEQQGRTSMQTLQDYLRDRQLLLILDNCEHLTAACAPLADNLLSHAHSLHILATSREPLGVAGETDWLVPSLSMPDVKQPLVIEQISQYEAVQLFIDRALLAQPHFRITRDNAPAIAEICSRLDGIPLALELAAARVRSLSVDEISVRLTDRFRLLTGGARTSLPRQQTLRATLDWSYNLLSDEEKKLLRSLAVFSGGWTLNAAERICSGDGDDLDILDLLSRLVDKSLAVMNESSGHSRYHLLETTRQYAHEKLGESNEAQHLRDRHLDFFLQMAEELFIDTIYAEPQSLDALEADHDNLRAALEYAIGTSTELAVSLGIALESLWENRGYHKEGYAWARRLLSCTENEGPNRHHGRALGLAAFFANDLGESGWAREFGEASLKIAEILDDRYQLAKIHSILASIYLTTGDFDKSKLHNEKSLFLFQELDVKWGIWYGLIRRGSLAMKIGDRELAYQSNVESLDIARRENAKGLQARTLNSLGELARLNDDYKQAVAYYKDSFQLFQETGNKLVAAIISANLGEVALHEKDPIQAKSLFIKSFEIARMIEHPRVLLGCLEGFAGVAAIARKYEQAAQLFGAVQASYEMMGTKRAPADEMEYNRCIDEVREHLNRDTFDSAWAEGLKLSMKAALELALKTLDDI